MPALLYFLSSLAAIGLAVSLLSHVTALFGTEGPLGELTPSLHVAIFPLAIPMILVMGRLTKHAPQRDLWKAALRGCPRWMRYTAWGFFGYAFVNFGWLLLSGGGGSGRGTMPPEAVRGFSGHWMAFYAIDAAVYYSAARLWHESGERRCTNGHPLSPLAKFCDQCGEPVGVAKQ